MSHEGGIGNLWAEIGRRNVGRVALVYAGAAWGLVHMSTVMAEALEIPHWVNRYLVFLLVALAPFVIGFSWVFELTPEGFKRAEEVEQNAALSGRTARRLDIAIIVLIVALAGLYGTERFLMPHEGAENAHIAAEGAAKAPASEGTSLAVLPFLNLSSDKEQEFFSDGMTEEITSALAKVKGLKVVARTSAFEFKGENKNVQQIGQALHASHLLEGSVRKAGNRVRITGQLIRADDGTHIWTEDYDRELTDVFKTQDEIAQAIAGALRVPLGLKPEGAAVGSRSPDAEVYEQYLRAKAMYRARLNVVVDAPKVIEAVESVVARTPDYAPAWGLLAIAYTGYVAGDLPPDEFRHAAETFLPKAEAAGRRAIALDPDSADSYPGLAFALQSRGKFQEAEELFKKGLAIDPYNPDLLHYYASALQFEGRLKEALALRRQLTTLEPLFPSSNVWAASVYIDLGQYETALVYEKAIPPERADRLKMLLQTYAALGRREDAAEAILQAPAGQVPPEEAAAAVKLLRAPPAAAIPRDLPEFPSLRNVYYFVAPERVLEFRLRANENEIAAGFHFPRIGWGPMYASTRKSERFKTLIRNAGLVDYWRAHGWPEVCHPVGNDDFACS